MMKELRWTIPMLLFVFVASACMTKNNSAEKIARTACKRVEECALGEFEEEFSSIDDCVYDATDGLSTDRAIECYEEAGCEYRGDRARECRRAIASASCDDFVNESFERQCEDIWSCTDQQFDDARDCFR